MRLLLPFRDDASRALRATRPRKVLLAASVVLVLAILVIGWSTFWPWLALAADFIGFTILGNILADRDAVAKLDE